MELGDVSSLGASIAKCVAYHRDRKEPYGMVEARDTDASEVMSLMSEYGVDFMYTYNENNEWDCLSNNGTQIDILSGKVALN
jgi:hypothetical protein